MVTPPPPPLTQPKPSPKPTDPALFFCCCCMTKGLRELMIKQISIFVGLSSAIAVARFRGFQNNQSSNWRCLELVWWKNQHEGIVGNVCRSKVKTGTYLVVYLLLNFLCLNFLCLFVKGHAKGQWYNAWQDEDSSKGPSTGIGLP